MASTVPPPSTPLSPKSEEDDHAGDEGDEGDDADGGDWESFIDKDGKEYYYNKKTQQTQWEKPDEEEEDDEEVDEEESASTTPKHTPSEWIPILQNHSKLTLADVNALHLQISKETKTWKQDFVTEKGLVEITTILKEGATFAETTEKGGDEKIRLEVLLCLESYLDEQEWLTPILSTAGLLPSLVLCLSETSALRLKALELLSVICWLASEGRRSVLEALESTKFPLAEGGKKTVITALASLIKALKIHSFDEKTNKVQCNDMVLINSLVNSSEVLEERIALRTKFAEMDLETIIEQLSDLIELKTEKASEADRGDYQLLQAQLEIYDGGLIKDSRQTTRDNIDLSNPEKIWDYLKATAQEDGHTEQLTSILQMLMTIPEKGEKIWNNCKHIVYMATQLHKPRLQKSEVPPSPAPTPASPGGETPETPSEPPPPKPLASEQHYLTYEQLKAALDKKESDDQTEESSKQTDLEKKLEEQRSELYQLRMKAKFYEEKLAQAQVAAHTLQDEKKRAAMLLAAKMGTSVPTGEDGKSPEAPPTPGDGEPPSDMQFAVLALQAELEKVRRELEEYKAKAGDVPPAEGEAPPPTADDAPAPPPMDDAPAPPPMDGDDGAPPPPPMDDGGVPMPPSMETGPVLKPKKEIKQLTTQKLKKLHWTKIEANSVAKTVWKEVDDEDVIDKWITEWKEEAESFENLFSEKKAGKTIGGGGGGGGGDGDAKEETPTPAPETKKKKEAVRLVDEKRAYAADISLARFRMTPNAIRDAILEVENEIMTLDRLSALVKIVPTAEEVTTVKGYQGDTEELGNTEKFYLSMAEIPKLQTRLELTIFKIQYPNLIEAVNTNLKTIDKALQEIKNSTNLKSVLKIVLAMGNYLNTSTKGGQAYGFKLNTLKQLKNSKSSDNKTTLLMYLVKFVKAHFPETHKFPADVITVPAAAKIERKNLMEDVNQIKSKLTSLETELKTRDNSNIIDRFGPVMHKFLDNAKSQFSSFEKKFEEVEQLYYDSLQWYGESTQMLWEEYFDIFDTFAASYLQAEKRVEEDEKQAEKEKKRKEWLEQQKQKAASLKEGAVPKKKKVKGEGKKKKKKTKLGLYNDVKSVLGSGDDDLLVKMKMMRQTARPVDGDVQSAMGMLKKKRGDKSKKSKGDKEKKRSELRGLLKGTIGSGSSSSSIASTGEPKKSSKPKVKTNVVIQKKPKSQAAFDPSTPCKDCGCTDFRAHPFKVGSCTKCYHNHV